MQDFGPRPAWAGEWEVPGRRDFQGLEMDGEMVLPGCCQAAPF